MIRGMVDNRGCLGAVYRVTNDFLIERGLADEVKTKLPPDARQVLEKLPFAFAWREQASLEEIEKVLYAKSPQLAADLGFAAAKILSGGVVAPVFKMALSLFGQTMESIFGNLDRFFSMVVRGFTFRYDRAADKEGQVFVKIAGGPVHPSLFQQIRGNLLMMYAIVGTTGTVGEPVVLRSDESGADISLAVRWQ
jgi:hypothetical protein